MTNKITKDSYELIPDIDTVDKTAIYTVKLKHKPYHDVVIAYGKVSLTVNDDKETARLSFKYDILKGDKLELQSDDEFTTLVGDVLSHLIQEAFDSGNYQLGTPDNTSNVQSTTADDTSEARQ